VRELERLRRLFSGSVRYRLLATALVPMLVILPALLGVSILRWNQKYDAALLGKASDDLSIAHQYLGRLLENSGDELSSIANSADLQRQLNSPTAAADLDVFLHGAVRQHAFDYLYVITDTGEVVAGLPSTSAVRWNWPVIASALAGEPGTSIDLFQHSELAAISPDLAQRARIELVATQGSYPTTRSEETRGLVIQSAHPVLLPGGGQGALVGGILLNNNLAFVDTINDLIYHVPEPSGVEPGTVTLFLDDVRISTNVRLFGDKRAIGTRVSREVREDVLLSGNTWRNRAFVVDNWYISAYEPILDSFGNRVGMLYAGFLEGPFVAAKRQTLLEIAFAFLVAVAATVPLFLKWAAQTFRPLETMTATIGRVEAGDLAARTGHTEGSDEISQVAVHLDTLLDQVAERDASQRRWNEELNDRVDARTAELQLANKQLEETTRQLIMSEKLAAIGEITAGVAHEINNPVTVMQGNLEIIRDAMGSKGEALQTEFQLLDQQLHRIGDIVTRLLQFAKPQEYAGFSDEYDAAEIIRDTLPLVEHLLNKTIITVTTDFGATRFITMNRTELQQVLVNLLVNAIHAMSDGGTLTLRTLDRDEGRLAGVTIEVTDTGGGMTPEVMQRIFDPFFTTKRRKGTGLGLSISQMLVTRQDGNITVESEPAKGTTFSVWIPAAG
jgi:signal transduction histidine kinase